MSSKVLDEITYPFTNLLVYHESHGLITVCFFKWSHGSDMWSPRHFAAIGCRRLICHADITQWSLQGQSDPHSNLFVWLYAVMFEMSPVSLEPAFRFESLPFLPCQIGVLSDKNAPLDIPYDVDERERLSLWQPCRRCMRWRLSLRDGKRWYGCHSENAWWRHQMETFSALLAICAVNSPHKGQWRWALMFSLICAWINGWVNNREAGDLRRQRAHYDVIVMCSVIVAIICG